MTKHELVANRWMQTTAMAIAEAAIKSTNCTESAIDMHILAEGLYHAICTYEIMGAGNS